ncbi:S1C family serine protease [Microbacterium dauci]|uniref:Trypsin-like peptidase domain-containing protein n=1 Tax=Microbacterium dauci TaxID=3048008 RepID=A0ABT6ZCR0_9MICO|nr:trypsin-like peptidase domain-containing protein [Microbacterium sp. LX3-4]MDJ1113520.1 trypsin-like peptidase domain-containing protein [Microbacterium sp. LX3-4]
MSEPHTPGANESGAAGHTGPTDSTANDTAANSAAPNAQTTPVPGAEHAAVPPRPPLPQTSSFAAAPTQPHGYGWAGQAPGQPLHEQPEPEAAEPSTDAKVGAGKIVAVLVAAAIVGSVSGLGGAFIGSSMFESSSGTVVQSTPQNVTVNDTDSVNQTTGIAAKTLPSVVTISASSSDGGGTGSGVVLSEDGYVVTNTHVVTLDGATSAPTLRVTTSDGKVYDAEIVGTDPMYDLAVIKLEDASGLQPIEFADSSSLNVGDTTVAVGAPLGLSNTVTTGIVSALNRSIQIASSAVPDSGEQEDDQQGGQSPFEFDFGQGQGQSGSTGTISIAVIQTDAAINPGNSGGALVDDEGKLIGVNVAIATAGGTSSSEAAGSIGVGFSIPSNVVERIANELIDSGEATHGLLGAMVGNAADAEGSSTTGALISEVTDGGAAAAAGLRADDVVTEFNGVPIADATDLTAQVRALAAGADASLVYVRDGETLSADVTLGELTD